MEVGKFKSLGEGKVTGVSDNKTNEWKPPLRRHINPEGIVEFLTIRVRVLNGESVSITIREEIALAGDIGIKLLFGEAKRNTLTKRWVCSQLAASTIAGMQLQIAYGDYDEKRTPLGFLSEDISRLEQLIPVGMSSKLRASQWEEIITVQYKTMMGLSIPEKYIANVKWSEATWRTGTDQFYLTSFKNGKAKEFYLITPQTMMIENLCRKLKYKWAKEAGIIASNKASSIQNLASKRYAPLEKVVVDQPKGRRGSENIINKKEPSSRRGSENFLGKDKLKGSMEHVGASIESLTKRSKTILKGSAEQLSGTMNKLTSILNQDDKVLQEIRRAKNAGGPITASAEAVNTIQDVKLPSSHTNLKTSQNLSDSKENVKHQVNSPKESKTVENVTTSKENLQHQPQKLRNIDNTPSKPKEPSKLVESTGASSAKTAGPQGTQGQQNSTQPTLPQQNLQHHQKLSNNPNPKLSSKPNDVQPIHAHKLSNKPDGSSGSQQSSTLQDSAKPAESDSQSSSVREQKPLFNNARLQKPFRPSSPSVQNNTNELALLAQLDDLGSSLDQNVKLSRPDSLKKARGPVNSPKSRLTEADFALLAKLDESAKAKEEQKVKEAPVEAKPKEDPKPAPVHVNIDTVEENEALDKQDTITKDRKPKTSHNSSKHSANNDDLAALPQNQGRKQSIVNENVQQTFVKPKNSASRKRTIVGKITEAISQPMEVNKRVNDKFDFDKHLGGVGPTQLIDKRENK
ncbi:hypothetical protein HDV06_003514 [Boothiomyces sp. JEL0866]|nr:hypothetical protein HDV06_003482 [Boothiomyces sp. JEL0866]KAJ3325744.1 hypothetical protein HDV06_003514 [Boothiomyces sp. JEL0866]